MKQRIFTIECPYCGVYCEFELKRHRDSYLGGGKNCRRCGTKLLIKSHFIEVNNSKEGGKK